MKTIFTDAARAHKVLLYVVATCVLAVGMTTANGCSVYMAAKQPNRKNLEVFSVGTPRSLVLAEIGQPQASETKDGKRVDVFSFVQGYSKGAKAGRALFHGAADVFTLGMWEVVGTPTEAIFTGEKVAYEVTYNTSDKVEKVITLLGKKDEAVAQIAQGTEGEPAKATKVQPKVDPTREDVAKEAENDD